jgi:hypothetical protein
MLAICYDALLPTTCNEKTHTSFKDPVGLKRCVCISYCIYIVTNKGNFKKSENKD